MIKNGIFDTLNLFSRVILYEIYSPQCQICPGKITANVGLTYIISRYV